MINFLKKHKNVFIGLFLVLFIFSLFILIIYFENKDRENVKKTVLSDINLVDDSNNLNKSWSIDNNGNLVGSNLLGGMIHNSTSRYSTAYYSSNDILFLDNVIYTFVCYRNYNPSKVSSYYLNERLFTMVEGYSRYFLTNTTNIYLAQFTASGEASSNEIIIKNEADNTDSYYDNDLYNFMILEGAYTLDTVPNYEPYGIYYSPTNYTNYGNVKYSEGYQVGYNDATNDIYVNNPFYNANVKYYTTLSSVNPWFTFTLDNSLLQNSNTFDVNQAIKTFLSVNEQQDYYDSPDIGYFKVDFAKSFSASEMVYLVNAQYPFQFDHYFTFYFDDNSQYVFHNPITNNSSDYYYQYDVSLANTDINGKRVIGLSFRRGARDIVNSVSQSQYNIGYNDGYSVGYNNAVSNDNEQITSLTNENADLNSQIESLQYQLNIANENAENDLNGLTYTMISAVMSTPFNILHDMLNFNFFGINVFSLFTSLITLLLLIWVIKFLIGRK